MSSCNVLEDDQKSDTLLLSDLNSGGVSQSESEKSSGSSIKLRSDNADIPEPINVAPVSTQPVPPEVQDVNSDNYEEGLSSDLNETKPFDASWNHRRPQYTLLKNATKKDLEKLANEAKFANHVENKKLAAARHELCLFCNMKSILRKEKRF